ncbi:uncharacterized protein LOC121530271 [Drosophila eugracilis]|uniref:uncharacterized protein LOC121530271 n=1 Tax=Drosophila eugracilis TaxID=29029 RepID=UPI001BDABD32|nr:uncharacterized protein LOC121530271 [Drosophila eugracilis]
MLRIFRKRVITRIGAPKVLISDNGVQFTGKKTKTAIDRWGLQQQFTAPLTSQQKPTERTNRRGTDQMGREDLPELILAYNSSTLESTGYIPSQLLYGKELRLPGTLFDRVTQGSGLVKESLSSRWERLKKIRSKAHKNMEEAAETQKRHYDLRKRAWKPSVGKLVSCRTHLLLNAAEKLNARLTRA